MVPSEVGCVSLAIAQCCRSNGKKRKVIQQYVIDILAFCWGGRGGGDVKKPTTNQPKLHKTPEPTCYVGLHISVLFEISSLTL